jgi:ribonucleoside-diphosphate reductase alpha chain
VSEQVQTQMSPAQTAVLCALAAAPGESDLEAVSARVARAVTEAEPPGDRARLARRYAEMMQSQRFLPSIPILANAGRSGNLAACYVLEPQDSLASIYAALTHAALIQQGAGGAGVNFSNLRPAGAPIHRSGGRSPGPLAFVELFAHSAQVNRRSGRRPGAHLAVLEIGHPDVGDFVGAARNKTDRLSGMGLALGLTDAFLRAAASGESFELRHPAAPEARAVRADLLLRDIAEAIVANGEPSLLFLDTIQAANPAPHLGPIRATNPCGEQPLLPGESCVLGSVQLPVFARDGGELDWKALGDTVADAVRFLDDVIDVAHFPDERMSRATRRTRKIGIGFMGLADLALLRGIPYDGEPLRDLAAEITRFMSERACEASEALAEERSPYPAWTAPGTPRRNATLLAIAPTGTLSLVAACSSGLEPFLTPVRSIEVRAGTARSLDRWLDAWARKQASDPDALLGALHRGVPARELPGIDPDQRGLLRRAAEVEPAAQIHVQAAVQRFVDGAVSKTVHLPLDTSADEVLTLIRLAHTTRCKGVAFFRTASAPTL